MKHPYLLLRPAVLILLLLLAAPAADAQLFWNQAAQFNGTGYAVVPHSPELNITASFTIECWVWTTDLVSVPILVQKRTGANSEGYTLYMSAGRPAIRTNASTRLRTSGTIPSGIWTHLAATYNSTSDLFAIYINGGLDTSFVDTGAAPAAGTDSVRLGTGFNQNFGGMLDEVRIWNRALSSSEIIRNMRTSIAASGGVYSGLVLSLTFQDDESAGAPFSLADWSGQGNNAVNRGLTAVDYLFAPPTYLSWNEGVYLDGSGDYLVGSDASAISPTSALTLQAWVFPTTTATGVIVNKGFSGSTMSYRFFLTTGNVVRAGVNNTFVSASGAAPENRWTHVAFTYNSAGQAYAFYINGEPAGSGTLSAGAIPDGTDTLLIGGGATLAEFTGFIDEVRIAGYAKSAAEIRDMMFVTMDQANEQNSGQTNVCYSLNGYTTDACADGAPRLEFRGNAVFSAPAFASNVPVAPLGRAPAAGSFAGGYRMHTSDRRIPASGTSGLMVRDSLYCSQSVSLTDVNVFLAINHTWDADLEVALISPSGDSVRICTDWSFRGADDNIIAVFDDEADSSYTSTTYTAPGPIIRPAQSMNAAYAGDNAQGWWILHINDDAGSDTGRLYGWGIQINNQTVVGVGDAPALPEAFRLAQNYPNPFNPSTVIEYDILRSVPVKLEIFDILGRLVETPVDEVQAPGTYKVSFTGVRAASGTYFYRLRAGDFVQTKKMLLLR